MKPSVVVTCEHAGNEVPPYFAHLFQPHQQILLSHRGWDSGAYQVAEFLAEGFQCNLFGCHLTRLLIETNRSIHSNDLFSEFSKNLSEQDKQALVNDVYYAYRNAVEQEIESLEKPVFHLSVHSFTPVLNGVERHVDIGLLFDPARSLEKDICTLWVKNLLKALPDKCIQFNQPYLGTDDGFTTYLRTRFSDPGYAGIEIEINQKFADSKEMVAIQAALLNCFPV
jgi:predicted N-formylglutamate amidohydrolase